MTDRPDAVPLADVDAPVTIAFVCVQNAGRSQLATAFAERERDRRGLDAVKIVTGGTDPADAIHPVVADAMVEVGLDPVDREPRAITPDELATCDVVCTMGCSVDGICPATWRGDARDWNLADPHGADPETVSGIRDAVDSRVRALFDELEAGLDD
ncbi:protein tyrosine phosphatase [Halovivax asiaticus JCM 14624]|uniref:Protein tyrosine phosphatase n=1 Tax=Halovivax asiaticus JCM 14624 TaxID=1227490 RepID=M0BMT8_9EURY|nr:protein-tyrosine-phosphatase [Halovivax asiaticus]ELZ12175.1 protein tyrosine phosphatase [Halovivax asiaticus JCM 14624]